MTLRGKPMLDRLTDSLNFNTQALVLRAERQRVIAGNIANADTPGFAARDFDFNAALKQATAGQRQAGPAAPGAAQVLRTQGGHLGGSRIETQLNKGDGPALDYTVSTQASADQNTVDMDRERSNFVDNAVRYEATLRFINGQVRTMLSAIQGQ